MGFVAAALIFASGPQASAADGEPTVIVALGDSLTAGYGLPQNQSFPAQLEAALKARGAECQDRERGRVGRYGVGRGETRSIGRCPTMRAR